MEAPRFYLKTVDQDGRPVEPEVLVVVLDALGRAVPAQAARLTIAQAAVGCNRLLARRSANRP
jgi:hypothetical protein